MTTGQRMDIDIRRRIRRDVSDGRCGWCDRKLPAAKATLEHLVPRSEHGPNWSENTVAACLACNGDRGVLTPARFFALLAGRDPRSRPLLVGRALRIAAKLDDLAVLADSAQRPRLTARARADAQQLRDWVAGRDPGPQPQPHVTHHHPFAAARKQRARRPHRPKADGRCLWCGMGLPVATTNRTGLLFLHVTPLIEQVTGEARNLIYSCGQCRSARKGRSPAKMFDLLSLPVEGRRAVRAAGRMHWALMRAAQVTAAYDLPDPDAQLLARMIDVRLDGSTPEAPDDVTPAAG